MKTMGWSLNALAGAALLGATLMAAPTGTSAQQRTPGSERDTCKCVDSSGKEIPDCACFRTLGPGDFMVRGSGRPEARARLGVTVSVTQAAKDDAKGARVQSVLDDGPAATAGIREGDIITRVDGKSLFEPLGADVEKHLDLDESVPVQRLLAIVAKLDPDTKVEVEYLRDGSSHTTTVSTRDLDRWGTFSVMPGFGGRILGGRMDRLHESLDSLARSEHLRGMMIPDEGRRLRIFTDSAGYPDLYLQTPGGGTYHLWGPDTTDVRSWRCPGADDPEMGALDLGDECVGGLKLMALNPGLASYFKTDKGVLVSDVTGDSTTGLEPGDVILEIGGREVTTADKARRILASYGSDEAIDFHIVRKGKAMDVRGHLGG